MDGNRTDTTDPGSNPQTAALEQVVKDVGLWDVYQSFIETMIETANIKYPRVPNENRDAFIKTCKYSFCAGVNEAFRKMYEDIATTEH